MSEVDDEKREVEVALSRSREAYRMVFLEAGVHRDLVLTDLQDFCHWRGVAFDPADGGLGLAFREGQRSVFARILNTANMTEDELDEIVERTVQVYPEQER